MNAREIAYKVLLDVEKNKNYSNMSINKHFKDVRLSNQDRGLATEIIYGVIENKYYIDYMIDKLSKVKTNKMEIYVKTLLRMGIYQIMFLNSISDYAAVNETVNLAKKKNSKISGFINGILRNVIRQKETIGDIKTKDDVDYLSIKYSYDKWMIRNWMIHFGKEFTEELLEANNERPSIYLRTNTLKITRDELIKKLEEQNIKASKVNVVDEAIKVEHLKDIETWLIDIQLMKTKSSWLTKDMFFSILYAGIEEDFDFTKEKQKLDIHYGSLQISKLSPSEIKHRLDKIYDRICRELSTKSFKEIRSYPELRDRF